MGFLLGQQGNSQGLGLGGTSWGCHFFSKFNQIWFESISHKGMFKRHIVLVPPPWGLEKRHRGRISLIFNSKVNSKDFKTKLRVSFHK